MVLRDVQANLDILHTPDSLQTYELSPALYGIPVLFPPNRIEDGMFTFHGRTYHFPLTEPKRHNHIHGFVNTRPWSLREHAVTGGRPEVTLVFVSTEFPDVLAVYPHPFRIVLTYALEENRLVQRVQVANDGDNPMPWGLGFHTTFNLPLRAAAPLDAAEVMVSLEQQWVLGDRLLPTGDLIPVPNAEGWRDGWRIAGHALDDAFVAKTAESGGEPCQLAIITDHDTNTRITYRCDKRYGHWVIYNADGQQRFVSLEPYTWITNAPNLDLPADVTGFAALPPGDSVTLWSEIVVDKL